MTGPLWAQIVFIVVAGVPVVAVLGLLLMMAAGGVLGCAACACCRFGFTGLSPAISRARKNEIVPA